MRASRPLAAAAVPTGRETGEGRESLEEFHDSMDEKIEPTAEEPCGDPDRGSDDERVCLFFRDSAVEFRVPA